MYLILAIKHSRTIKSGWDGPRDRENFNGSRCSPRKYLSWSFVCIYDAKCVPWPEIRTKFRASKDIPPAQGSSVLLLNKNERVPSSSTFFACVCFVPTLTNRGKKPRNALAITLSLLLPRAWNASRFRGIYYTLWRYYRIPRNAESVERARFMPDPRWFSPFFHDYGNLSCGQDRKGWPDLFGTRSFDIAIMGISLGIPSRFVYFGNGPAV